MFNVLHNYKVKMHIVPGLSKLENGNLIGYQYQNFVVVLQFYVQIPKKESKYLFIVFYYAFVISKIMSACDCFNP